MTPEQKERLTKIEIKATREPRSYPSDTHFLLSLVKSQEAASMDDLSALKFVDRWLWNPPDFGSDGRFTEGMPWQDSYKRDAAQMVKAASITTAASMRSACVEKVRASLYNPSLRFSDEGIKAAVTDWTNILIKRLESVSIQEQKQGLCGASRPDDGSECAFGFCPRPRDGCSEYCVDHHASVCIVQEQEAKQL